MDEDDLSSAVSTEVAAQVMDRLKISAKRARYVGRPASASTAAGQMSRHMKELQAFINEAFA